MHEGLRQCAHLRACAHVCACVCVKTPQTKHPLLAHHGRRRIAAVRVAREAFAVAKAMRVHAPLLPNLCDQSETGPLVVFHATLPGLLFAPGKIYCRIVITLHLTSACLRVLLAHPHTDTPPRRPPSGLSMGAWEWRPALRRAAGAER